MVKTHPRIRTLVRGPFALLIVALTLPAAPQTATAATTCPLDVVLLLDVSGSMRSPKGDAPRDRAVALASEVARRLDGDDRVAIISFAAETESLSPLTYALDGGKRHLPKHVAEVSYRGKHTDFGVALRAGRTLLRTKAREKARPVLLLLTDGELDVAGGAEATKERRVEIVNDIAPSLAKYDIRTYGFALSDDADVPVLAALAHATHASHHWARNEGELTQGVEKIFGALDRVCPTWAAAPPPKEAPRPSDAPPARPETSEEPERESVSPAAAPQAASGLAGWLIGILVGGAVLLLALVALLLARRKSAPVAVSTPAPRLPVVPVVDDSASLGTAVITCVTHPGVPARGTCNRCRDLFCDACVVTQGDRAYCKSCAQLLNLR